jgi:hypothetical protein
MEAYLVFFVRDPVDDALADAILARVRAVPGAGWFDDPGAASPAERTTGGYVKVAAPEGEVAAGLLAAAREVSAEHGVTVEVHWREEVYARIERGAWRSSSAPGGAG